MLLERKDCLVLNYIHDLRRSPHINFSAENRPLMAKSIAVSIQLFASMKLVYKLYQLPIFDPKYHDHMLFICKERTLVGLFFS